MAGNPYEGAFTPKQQKEFLNQYQKASAFRIENEKLALHMIEELNKRSAATTEEEKKKIVAAAVVAVQAVQENAIKKLSLSQQVEERKKSIKRLQAAQMEADIERDTKLAALEAIGAKERELDEVREEYAEKEAARKQELARLDAEMFKAESERMAKRRADRDKQLKGSTASGMWSGAKAQFKDSVDNRGDKSSTGAGLSSILNSLGKLGNLSDTLKENAKVSREVAKESAKRVEEKQAEYEAAKEAGASEEELARIFEEGQKLQLEATKDANTAAVAEMKAAAQEMLANAYKEAYKEATDILSNYKGKIDARMQGSGKSFQDMQNMISNNLALSPFVKTTEVLKKLSEATEAGISYNVEQRAFLAGIADKIATTFNAFDSNLLRLIRLQQADSTAARMGMEASLTKLFNGMFQDTSYLKDVYDSVSAAIIDANSQLTRDASAEFEYTVQKWLGALSSLGMNSNTITSIAQGLNYLATGDVTNLSNNSSLQTLFAMAASNANLEYSELLLNGLDADKTNRLLNSMVIYLKKIAEGSDNQVMKAAYGEIFNMSLSDMTSLRNLTAEEISSIAENHMTYEDMTEEMETQINQLVRRTSMAEMLDNVYKNVLFSVTSDMASNPATFFMQKMVDFMDQTKTDIYIPFVNAGGFGLDVNTSVKGLLQMGLGVGQALSLAGTLASALTGGPLSGLDAWGATETTQRGRGMNLTSASTLGGVSNSVGTYAQSGNSSDTANSTMSSATDDAEESKKITNKNSKPPEYTIEDLYKAIVGDSASSYAVVKDSVLMSAYDDSSNGIRTTDYRLKVVDSKLMVHDTKVHDVVSEIVDLMSNKTATSKVVRLEEGSLVSIKQEDMVAAFREALYGSKSSGNFSEFITRVSNNDIGISSISGEVSVKNDSQTPLYIRKFN